MKVYNVFFIILIPLFLFSCGKDDVNAEMEMYDPIGTIKYVDYQTLLGSAECINVPRPADTYVYPIVPGTEEWMELHQKGMDEVLKACRVPEDILQKQSTQAVIQAFFDYPFVLDMYAGSSTLLDGFINSAKYNSAYAELLKRNDAGTCLLERYLLYDPVGCDAAILMAPLLEMLLAQPEFYSRLTTDESKQLVKEALQKNRTRIDFEPLLRHQNATTCLLMGRVMVNAKYNPFIKKASSNRTLTQYLEKQNREFNDYATIISYANQFIKL